MSKWTKIGLVALLGAASVALLGYELGQAPSTAAEARGPDKLPKLLDLGSKKCIPCIKMAPILVELTKEYAGRFDVEFIDVWLKENEAAAGKYGIKLSPRRSSSTRKARNSGGTRGSCRRRPFSPSGRNSATTSAARVCPR